MHVVTQKRLLDTGGDVDSGELAVLAIFFDSEWGDAAKDGGLGEQWLKELKFDTFIDSSGDVYLDEYEL
jgi:hypothetical protein